MDDHEKRLTEVDVLGRFEPRELTAQQHERIGRIRDAFKIAARAVLDELPAGRERGVVLTHLEEAGFMAVAGIARGPG